jgi:hypothetical protein
MVSNLCYESVVETQNLELRLRRMVNFMLALRKVRVRLSGAVTDLRSLFMSLSILLRKLWVLLLQFKQEWRLPVGYLTEEYFGLEQWRILHIRESKCLKCISVFRFDNNQGAIVCWGDMLLDPWQIVPIRFVAESWFFETAGPTQYVNYFGGGYGTHKGIVDSLKRIQALGSTPIEPHWNYKQRVTKDKRMYPTRWLQVNWALQFKMN